MTPEAQRIAIAEACGWKEVHQDDDGIWGQNPEDLAYKGDRGMAIIAYQVPDYLSDLNAMHEAEKALTGEQAREFVGNIAQIKFRQFSSGTPKGACPMEGFGTHATAAQRAEAFLKALGKWEDDK